MKKIKLLLLADARSPHSRKWALHFARDSRYEVSVFSLLRSTDNVLQNEGVKVFCPFSFSINRNSSGLSKLRYLLAWPALLFVILRLRPHILHSHYATSYGLLGSLCFFHPFIVSVWGSDVFDFPNQSVWHKRLLAFNLKRADRIFSTSKAMAEELKKIVNKEADITPFGIDTDLFKPQTTASLFAPDDIVIGTIKSLEKIYGIDLLIKTFAIIKEKHPALSLKLLVVGDGTLRKELHSLCVSLGISESVVFTGYIDQSQLVNYYNMLDVYVALSRSESFGVAVLEASACGIPVVVSNVGGLPEVIDDGLTGFVVEPDNVNNAVDVLRILITDKSLRKKMGNNARLFTERYFKWENNIEAVSDIYVKLIKK